jgi:N-acetylglucosaminyldiphosphoundecaprenol N-acetyl-beta-D-mannosaminyltransferase
VSGGRVPIMGFWFDPLTERGAAATIADRVDAAATGTGRGGVVVTANLDFLRRMVRDESFADLVRTAELTVADGMPLVWASRIAGHAVPERVAGSNLIDLVSAELAQRGRRVFLLGGNPGVAERAAAVLGERHPGLVIVGTRCPPVGFENDEKELAAIEAALVAARPDLVYVALGSPKQERLIARLRGALPRAWWIGVGISFSFVAGEVPRAPRWAQRAGLEWLHRLAVEPRRLARRYLIDGLPFAARLGVGGMTARVGRRPVDPRPRSQTS